MESKGFLLNFSNLASGSEDLIKSALQSINSTLLESKGEVDTIIGKLTPDLKYTIDRLLKGLTGGKSAKLGFSLALCGLFENFKLNHDKIFEYFESLDHSGISQYQIFVGTLLISMCLSRAGKQSPKSLVAKVLEIYSNKSSLREIAAIAISSMPNAKIVAKKIEKANEINSFLVNYSIQSPESVMAQVTRHKEIILKGSFKSLPRLHNIWKIIISACIQQQKEQSIWMNFVEKDLKIEDKLKSRRILFSFLAFEEFIYHKGNISEIMTKDFFETWQENLFSKKFRDHSKAVTLKEKFSVFLKDVQEKKVYLQKLLNLTSEVKSLDMIKGFAEDLLINSAIDVKKWYLSEISGFTKDKKGNFAVGEYVYVGKIESELFSACLKKLIDLSRLGNATGESARIKVLSIACESNQIDEVLKILKSDEKDYAKVSKIVEQVQNYQITPSESKTGKRKAGDLGLITSSQLVILQNLLKVIAIESLLYHQIEDLQQIKTIVKDLYSAKVKNYDDLCMFLFSSLARSANYIRTVIKKTFKEFVNEISDEFLQKVCDIIKSGNVNIDGLVEENEESETNGVNVLFEESKNTKNNQEKIMKDNFLIKATDILEIIIKKSKNFNHKLKAYETLILSIRSASKIKEKQHLVGKFSSVLQKIHKKPFEIEESHEKELINLITLCIKGMYRDKNLNKILCKNFLCLLKNLDSINNEESLKILMDLLVKFFEKHSSNIKVECMIDIFTKFRYRKEILNKLFKYLKKGRNPLIQVQCSEILKASLKQWKVKNSKFLKRFLKIGRKIEKQECKVSLKNNILKNILGCLLVIGKHVEKDDYPEYEDDIEKFKLLLGDKPNLHGLFIQIKNDLKKNIKAIQT